ncbi:acyl-CoA reductase [Apibacter raozihei]|uniref:acyl-CoA reductase n=1 Tax=Apibacter raozihei TaxID=2500547 RepID=UPI000FE3F8D1|nr:acyl-CoA reductase [Apibacter raozihei]
MSLELRIKSLEGVRNVLHQFIKNEVTDTPSYSEFENSLRLAEIKNPWFTKKNILTALEYWDRVLTSNTLFSWLEKYSYKDVQTKTIGLVLAGNIPMVGLHDCLCVLLLGFKAKIKLSSKDNVLIPFILNLWKEFCDELEFEFVEKLEKFDAVITTGSNNTARYFEYYFKDIPHIIRKNRTSAAILTGNESEDELIKLSNDIFTYFGLGCRSVTQVFIPENFDLDRLFQSFIQQQDVIHHNKYANNYDYNKAIYLMNNDQFWDNNFIMLKNSEELYSPIGVLYFTRYDTLLSVESFMNSHSDKIQCIVSGSHAFPFKTIPFGESQNPDISEYADGIDTINFLLSI